MSLNLDSEQRFEHICVVSIRQNNSIFHPPLLLTSTLLDKLILTRGPSDRTLNLRPRESRERTLCDSGLLTVKLNSNSFLLLLVRPLLLVAMHLFLVAYFIRIVHQKQHNFYLKNVCRPNRAKPSIGLPLLSRRKHANKYALLL